MTDEKFLKLVGEHIVDLRQKRSLSQADLAKDVKTSKNTIGRIERGEVNPSVIMLRGIARELKTTVARIVDVE
jgi:DNA-binding XRE family transcriptional regulator